MFAGSRCLVIGDRPVAGASRRRGAAHHNPLLQRSGGHRAPESSCPDNGICERFHRTVLDEFYRVAFRKKIYRTVEYNQRRSHQGRWCFGKTPMQTFLDAIPLAKEKLMAA